MIEEFDIDKQIDEIEREIAVKSKELFEAQGMLRLALHMKKNCIIFPRKAESENHAPSTSA